MSTIMVEALSKRSAEVFKHLINFFRFFLFGENWHLALTFHLIGFWLLAHIHLRMTDFATNLQTTTITILHVISKEVKSVNPRVICNLLSYNLRSNNIKQRQKAGVSGIIWKIEPSYSLQWSFEVNY